MYQNVLDDIIGFYKKNYEAIEEQEIYKWRAIQHFQENWENNPIDFHEMLTRALAKTQNLLSSGSYFPLRVILRLSEVEPLEVKAMFQNLFDEDMDLTTRIITFKDTADDLLVKCFPNETYKSYQDHRAAMAYLTHKHPNIHFLYKFQMYKDFAELIDYNDKPKAGDVNNVITFEKLCEFIISKVVDDKELLELYKSRQKIFADKNFHLLAQDIIFAGQYYKDNSILENDNYERVTPVGMIIDEIEFKPLTRVAKAKKINLKASKVNFEAKQRLNKMTGDFGELFVLEYEKVKVRSYGLKTKKVKWVSKTLGDGLGYDILSYDKDGNELFIEVKTTCGNIDSEFYITENELQCSIEASDKFRLYRVYKFDKKAFKGNIAFCKGSLKDLCISPQIYSVKLSDVKFE